ncbi:MAG: class I SAM-dependent methyltransferase [Phycisphaerales bacterium]
MSAPTSATGFGGSVPQIYHTLLEPLIFEAYARDIAARLAVTGPARVLELACGTGIVTQKLASLLPGGVTLLASDLNPGMLQVARDRLAGAKNVEFQVIDGCSLPLPDGAFDAVVCQYGVMFFPDKVAAMGEARRVLKPGGKYVFNVWDALERNPMPEVADAVLAGLFPDNPPKFLRHGPYGWNDKGEIERVVRAGGFANVRIDTVAFPTEAPSAAQAAEAFVDGTPLRPALTDRGVLDTSDVRGRVAAALADRFGDRPCRSTMSALVVTAS